VIRLTWRQFRTQAFVASGALALVAVILAVTGVDLDHLYHTSGIATCNRYGDCSTVTAAFLSHYRFLQIALDALVVVGPGLVGIFWGAPLVARELETGTFRLAWTQSVTRPRWMAVKLGLVGSSGVAAAGLLSLAVTWWSSPVDRVNAAPFVAFDQRDLVPIGYAAFAFALAVTAGMLTRRTLPAMASTLAGFVAARVAVLHFVRPRLLPPLHLTSALQLAAGNGPVSSLGAGAISSGDWILSDQTINAAGQVIGQDGGIGPNGAIGFSLSLHGGVTLRGVGLCPNIEAGGGRASPTALQTCVDRLGLREVLTYQPTSHYWPLQWYEMAIFLALALALGGLCLWWVRRHPA
jgi:hypothetical protein